MRRPRTQACRAVGPYIAPPVQRAVRLIRHVAEGNPVLNMSETAKALKINRTTLLRLLHTLEVEGFVERRPGGAGYQVGLSFLELGARALFSQDLVQVAVPVLTRLAETLQLSAHLGVLDGTDVLYLVRRTPNTPLASNIRVGSRLPAHATTMGRMLLAYMPPLEIERLYAGKELQRFSDHTATTLEALLAKVGAGSRAPASPGAKPISSAASARRRWRCSISPARRSARSMSRVRSARLRRSAATAIGNALRAAGTEISRRLGWSEPDRPERSMPKPLVAGRIE